MARLKREDIHINLNVRGLAQSATLVINEKNKILITLPNKFIYEEIDIEFIKDNSPNLVKTMETL